ncbi:hypothetical protein HA466_0142820 [Hirschfeldia incana]|nr:hypothetical protein HA466_0142820 [Hirschfeldia incana]
MAVVSIEKRLLTHKDSHCNLHYQASPVSERSCPWNFQASLKVFSTKENTRYVSAHHTYLGDLLDSSHIVHDMENPNRFSE